MQLHLFSCYGPYAQTFAPFLFPSLGQGLAVALFAVLACGDPVNSATVLTAASTMRSAEGGSGTRVTQASRVLPSIPAPPDVAEPPADAQTTASGVAMKVLRLGGSTEHPMDNDCVKVHFTIWKRDGTMLSSSRLQSTPEVQCLQSAFPGVTEALKSMVVGEERRIWVPGRLTFTSDEEDEVPPKVDVTLDLELIEIIKAPPTPADLKAPPKTVVKTASGLAFQILKKGTGTQHPSPTSQVTLHLSGWTTDGTLFVSTVRGGHPAVYIVAHLIPGLHEGVLRMVTGEKRRFWIPAPLAYGEKTGRRGAPAGDLVYDVELLAVE